MGVWFFKLHSSICTVFCLHAFVLSYEVKVMQSELKLCEENRRVCVTEPTDCSPPSPSSVQKKLDMWCDYRQSAHGDSSLTCGWSPDSGSEASLIVTRQNRVLSCPAVFNSAATLNLTARFRDTKTGDEVWSEPRTVILRQAVRPPQPELTPLSDDSLLVSWTSSSDGSCRLRYRLNSTAVWTRAPDSVPVHANQKASYIVKDLLPFRVYRAAVSCRSELSVWTGWSPDAGGRTRDRAPSRPPDICYRVEETLPDGSRLVRLMWKPLDSHEAGGRVAGYAVSYSPGGLIHNVTESTAVVTMKDHGGTATVAAFNTAGSGPATHVRIDPGGHGVLPSVRHLWVSSLYPGEAALRVQWRRPEAPTSAPPLSHYAVLWRPESRAIGRWSAVSSFNTSAVIRDVDPDRSYLVSVLPVHNQQCGSAQSLPASLQRGALMEAGGLKVVSVHKTSVTVMWAWQNKSGPIRVKSYGVTLKKDQDTQTRTIWPDQNQLTFFNLTPNTQYSLGLLADQLATHIVQVNTPFDERLLATPVSLLLLLTSLLIVSILSGTVYRSYCFPPVSDPRESSAYRWLKDSNALKHAEKNILDISRFQVTESLIVVCPRSQLLLEEHLHQDAALAVSRLVHKPESRHPDWVQTAGDGREDEDEDEDDRLHSRPQEQQVSLVSNHTSEFLHYGHYVHQMTCRSDGSINDVVSGQRDCSDLVCETEYKNISEERSRDEMIQTL